MKIGELLSKIEYQELVVPEFQREYVWTRKQVKGLFSSLYKEWPTGSLLFWRVSKSLAPPIKKMQLNQKDQSRIDIILDGQQRLTALYLLIKGKLPPYYDKKDIAYDPSQLYFNLFTEEFEYYLQSKMQEDPTWQRVTWLFSATPKDMAELQTKIPQNSSGVQQFWHVWTKLKSISDRDYPIQTIPENASELEAIELFDRVNTMGTRLTKEELALAHIQDNWKEARRKMKEYQELARTHNFDFTLSFLVRCLTAVVCENGRPETIHNVGESTLKEGWTKVTKSLDYLIHLLPKEAYIDSVFDLISSRTLVPLVAHLHKHGYSFDSAKKREFFYWFYMATLWSRYSASPTTNLDYDVRTVSSDPDPVPKLIEAIRRQRGSLEVTGKDLEKQRLFSGFGKMILVLAKYHHAVDWFNGTPLSGSGSKDYHIELHHIFPSSVLYNKGGFDKDKISDRDLVNEIANRAFLTAKTNRIILNTLPQTYLSSIEEKFPRALDSQFVPPDRNLWLLENYQKFLAERRRMLAKGINDFMVELTKTKSDAIDIDALLKQDENQHLEFKATMRADIQEKGIPPKVLEDEVLKTIAAFMNQDSGGILLIGIGDDKNIVGINRDYATLGKHNRDGFLLHFGQIFSSNFDAAYEDNKSLSFVERQGLDIAVVKVTKAKEFVHFKGQNYVRKLNKTIPLTPAETVDYIQKVWG